MIAPIPPGPAARRDRPVLLVARAHPGLAPPALESEPCEGLAGPWESATWSRPGRRLKVVCFPRDTMMSLTRRDSYARGELVPGDPAPRVLAGIEWLMEED